MVSSHHEKTAIMLFYGRSALITGSLDTGTVYALSSCGAEAPYFGLKVGCYIV